MVYVYYRYMVVIIHPITVNHVLTVIIILPHIIFVIFKYVELLALIFSLFNIYTFDTICEN